ncbi:MAG: thioredoxin [Eubacteriaceae bacterium]|jgi:thioredoxin 1|nr:thioredoxin [Eubacteriaceae bacterium]
MTKIIKSNNFQEEVLKAEGVVLVDFFATWCGPCKALAPILDTISQEYEGKAKVFKIDVDEDNALAMEYRVMSVPTMKIFKNGDVVETLVGLRSEAELREKLNYYLAD